MEAKKYVNIAGS